MLLAKHGLVTWGETGDESYHATLEFVRRSVRAIDRAAGGGFGLGGPKVAEAGQGDAERLLLAGLPALRGALLEHADGVILEVDRAHRRLHSPRPPARPRSARSGRPARIT